MTEAAAWRVLGRGILLIAALVLLALFIRELKSMIVVLLVAVLFAAAATPFVDAITLSERASRWRWRPGRSLAAVLVFAGAVVFLHSGLDTARVRRHACRQLIEIGGDGRDNRDGHRDQKNRK